jgi:hypothetical protein
MGLACSCTCSACCVCCARRPPCVRSLCVPQVGEGCVGSTVCVFVHVLCVVLRVGVFFCMCMCVFCVDDVRVEGMHNHRYTNLTACP